MGRETITSDGLQEGRVSSIEHINWETRVNRTCVAWPPNILDEALQFVCLLLLCEGSDSFCALSLRSLYFAKELLATKRRASFLFFIITPFISTIFAAILTTKSIDQQTKTNQSKKSRSVGTTNINPPFTPQLSELCAGFLRCKLYTHDTTVPC